MSKVKPLTSWITSKTKDLKPGRTPDICPACVPKIKLSRGTKYYSRAELSPLRKDRYAKDYVVRCCPQCSKCFYYDNQNKRFIELAFRYKDFFGDDM